MESEVCEMTHPANTTSDLKPSDVKLMETELLRACRAATRDLRIATIRKAAKLQSEGSKLTRQMRWMDHELEKRNKV